LCQLRLFAFQFPSFFESGRDRDSCKIEGNVCSSDTSLSRTVRCAPVWKRLAALVVDLIIVFYTSKIIAIFGFPYFEDPTDDAVTELDEVFSGMPVMAMLFVWPIIYYVCFEVWCGATPGKLLFGIKVIKNDLSPMTFRRAFLRFWAFQFAGSITCLTYLTACFDKQNRALHDIASGSLVIDRNRSSTG
jgi:uncharacterized RDD family membrane protein YckC